MNAAAFAYLRAGFSVIPVAPGTKRPLVCWKQFQARRATADVVRGWYREHPGAGVAIVCGAVSGILVVDGDPRNGDGLADLAPLLPPTPTVETGGGGRHYYLRLPAGFNAPKIPALLPGVDLQAEASYVVAPPSIHPSGAPYRWAEGLGLGDVALPPLPAIVRDLIALHRRREDRPSRVASRNATAAALTPDVALSRLAGVRRAGAGWSALCPAHHDHEQSLSLAVGADGRLLAYCHAGCRFVNILAALTAGVPA